MTRDRLPTYRRHSSGQAFVEFQGRRHYLGAHGSPESKAEYERFIEAFNESALAAARVLGVDTPHDFTIGELTAAYWQHAERYYRKNDKATSTLYSLKPAIRGLNDLFADLEVRQFSPRKLIDVRSKMVRDKLSRKTINDRINQLKSMFAWGVEQELLPPAIWHGLLAVKVLKKGRTEAPESKRVRTVDEATVEATLPFLPPVVADMVRFQRLSGARPSEVCELRPCDVNRSDPRFIVGGEQIWVQYLQPRSGNRRGVATAAPTATTGR